jgi:predicted DNA-binding protein YlxM (UPF0122 family)
MRKENEEKKVILSAQDPNILNGLVRIPQIQHIFRITRQAIYYHIQTGRLTVYKCGSKTFIDPMEYARMKKWDPKYTFRDGKKVYDDNNFSISEVSKKLGVKYQYIYFLIRKGALKSKRVHKCIVLDLESLLDCAPIKEKVRDLITEFANAAYLNSNESSMQARSGQGFRQDLF